MVIGQVIDHASAIWLDGERAFREQWARQGGADLDELSEGELGQNISDGRIGLCLAVDRIDADLRRLIEYLNKITRDEISITALQLAYARHGDVEILVPSTYGAEIAAAKARSSGKKTALTMETVLDALASRTDRDLAVRLFELLDSLDERRGNHDNLWFGSRPGGGIFFYPYGLRISPFQLWVNKAGRLMAYGNWFQYSGVHRHHPGFAEVAEFVGQNHESTSKSFPLDKFDTDTFWRTAVRCAERINTPIGHVVAEGSGSVGS